MVYIYNMYAFVHVCASIFHLCLLDKEVTVRFAGTKVNCLPYLLCRPEQIADSP